LTADACEHCRFLKQDHARTNTAVKRLERFEPSVIRRDQTEQIVDRTLGDSGFGMSKVNRLLKNPDSRLFKKVQMRGAREIDERRRIY